MTGPHIPRLRATLRDLYQDAAVHQEMMAEATGEEVHFLARGECLAGLAVIDEVVDAAGRFKDRAVILIVRESLVGYLNEIGDSFPLKERLLQSLFRQIDAVQKVVFSEGAVAA